VFVYVCQIPSAKPIDMLDVIPLELPTSGNVGSAVSFFHSLDPSQDTAIIVPNLYDRCSVVVAVSVEIALCHLNGHIYFT
jgi:hypothetical protein